MAHRKNPIAPMDALLSGGMSASEFANTFLRGDRFTILIPAGRGMHGQEWAEKSGKAVMPMKADLDGVIRGWVLNMGGAHGTPGLARYENTVKVIRPGQGRIYQNGFILQSGKPASPDEREGNPRKRCCEHPRNQHGTQGCAHCPCMAGLTDQEADRFSREDNPRAGNAPEVLGRIVDAIRSGDEDYSYGAGWESLFSKALAWKDRTGGWMGNAREAQDILVWIGRASVNDDEEYSFGDGWDSLFAAARSFVPFLKMPPLGRSAGRRGNPGSFKAEVLADDSGKWCGNGLRFSTREQAEKYARDLQMRWTAVRDTRVVESDDPPDEPRAGNPELIEARADPRLPSTASERVLGVFRGGHLVGYIRKIHGTDTETFPWQAFHYPMGVRGGGKLLGSFYGPAGKTQATRAVASGRAQNPCGGRHGNPDEAALLMDDPPAGTPGMPTVKIVKFDLYRAEGPVAGDSWNSGRMRTFATLAEVNRALTEAASHMPSDQLGYDKFDFTIHYADGETYKGRYDLHPLSREVPDLGKHVRDFVGWYADKKYLARHHERSLDREAHREYKAFRDAYELPTD